MEASAWYFPFIEGASFIIVFFVIFLIGKFLKDWFTPYSIEEELTQKDNPAMAIALAGYYFGIVIIYIGALLGPSESLINDLLLVSGYSILGILLLNLARIINDKILLHSFSVKKELLDDRNPGTGVVLMGSYIASAMVIAGAIHGEGGSIITALVFYIIGQVALLLFGWIYDITTPYSIHDEIEQNNTAAGLGFSGGLIAIGLIIMKAVSGNFISWTENLKWVGIDVLIIFVYLIIVRLFFDKIVIARSDLNHEIKNDKNIGAGLLEFTISIAFSAILFFVL